MPYNNEKLQLLIELLCLKGCQRVNEIIEILERQESIEETRALNAQECRLVLLELKAVMAVYESKP